MSGKRTVAAFLHSNVCVCVQFNHGVSIYAALCNNLKSLENINYLALDSSVLLMIHFKLLPQSSYCWWLTKFQELSRTWKQFFQNPAQDYSMANSLPGQTSTIWLMTNTSNTLVAVLSNWVHSDFGWPNIYFFNALFIKFQDLSRSQFNKEIQVYFRSRTLVFTNSHQFKSTKSLYKFPLEASNLYLLWYSIGFKI